MLPFTICTVFVCTHVVGGGRDKGLSFLTHCLVTLSGYDRACTCSSSFSSLVFPLPIFTSENDRNCTLRRGRGGRDRENGGGGMGEMWGSHMFTQNTAKGYQLPISINSSGLASLDASGGWGQYYPCVGSQLAVCRAKTEAYNIKKKRTVWISSWLDKRMWWEHPDASNRGDIAACASVAARMHCTLSRSALGAASPVYSPFTLLPLSFCRSTHSCCSHRFPDESRIWQMHVSPVLLAVMDDGAPLPPVIGLIFTE